MCIYKKHENKDVFRTLISEEKIKSTHAGIGKLTGKKLFRGLLSSLFTGTSWIKKPTSPKARNTLAV